MAVDEYGSFPLQTYLGMQLETPEPGRTVARVDVGEHHQNPNGVVHGGVIFTMVDTAMGGATMSVLADGEICASIEVQLRFLRPAIGDQLEAETTVVRQGRRIIHLESRVRDGDGELIATGAGSFAVIADPSRA
ncbi:MAG: PaaI family thioesterase [Acidimicrobiia bacterium]|nr:PaaI family thioesterase [Acidimicrobiia bacterium]